MPERRTQVVFLSLIAAQAAHSAEEYATGLYEVFAPARFVSSLFSTNLSLGFLVVNTALIGFGVWCWVVPVRSGWRASNGLVWSWTLLEIGNGLGHLVLAALRGHYFPGAATAPLLLLIAGWQFCRLVQIAPTGPSTTRAGGRRTKNPDLI
jgi:hypothetical protein